MSGCPLHTDTSTPAGSAAVVHSETDAQLDFSHSMSYGDYLGLDAILNAQHPRSTSRYAHWHADVSTCRLRTWCVIGPCPTRLMVV